MNTYFNFINSISKKRSFFYTETDVEIFNYRLVDLRVSQIE